MSEIGTVVEVDLKSDTRAQVVAGDAFAFSMASGILPLGTAGVFIAVAYLIAKDRAGKKLSLPEVLDGLDGLADVLQLLVVVGRLFGWKFVDQPIPKINLKIGDIVDAIQAIRGSNLLMDMFKSGPDGTMKGLAATYRRGAI